MQIYGILLNIRGILLNIRGILLNIRGKSEYFGENRGIFEENTRKIKEFSRNSFLNLLPDDPFSRSLSVVFGRFRSFSRSFLDMIPIHSVFFLFHSFSFFIFKLYYYFCTGIYSINCSYEENYSNFSHHFYGY